MVNYKYTLSDQWISKISHMEEFANGAAQVTVKLRDGRVVPGVLISNSTHPIAVRGFKDLPFNLDEIVDVFQTDEDKNPKQHGGWDFWDDYSV